jgi:hypothetical protein
MSGMSAFKALYDRVEDQIQEAMARGEFDNLPGRGKPLQLDDDSHIPAELRMAYRILKRSGFPPGEVLMKKKVSALKDMLLNDKDMSEKDRKELKMRIMMADTELNMALERFRRQYGG